jgi:hypothetical protein
MLDPAFCTQLVLGRWSCLPGYPFEAAARAHLAEVLAECCVSVGHAAEVASTFEDRCPTFGQIRDCANSKRDKYVPQADPVDQWKREGATYDPNFAPDLVAGIAGRMNGKNTDAEYSNFRYQCIKNAVEKEPGLNRADGAERKFWSDYIAWLGCDHPAELAMARAAAGQKAVLQ